MHINLSHILNAHQVLEGRIIRTPLISSAALSRRITADVWLKPEHWQLTGSFKIRGALNAMAGLSEEERRRGVITASAGNHAQGVALAGQMLGISVVVVVPTNIPQTKLDGVRQLGAEVITAGDYYDASEVIAHEQSQRSGRTFIHAFEDPKVIAGQGTVGLEMLYDNPNLDTIVVPAGGGGLICGIGIAAHAINPNIEVIGIQSQASPAWYAAFQQGSVVEVEYQDTWAEGLSGGIGTKNFTIARRVVSRFELVSERDIRNAMHWAVSTHHWIVEGSAAVGLAWALFHGASLKNRRVGIVLTGGNLDTQRLKELLVT